METEPDLTRQFTISLYRSERASNATRALVDWGTLATALTTPEAGSKSGGAWSPIAYRADKRAASGAESICALVYDLDHHDPTDPTSGPPTEHDLEAIDRELSSAGCAYAICESYTAGRWRLTVPLAEDLLPRAYPDAWERVRALLCLPADPSGRDLARLFYGPRHPPGEERRAAVGGGAFLDLETIPVAMVTAQAESVYSALPSIPVTPGTEVGAKTGQENSTQNFSLSEIREAVTHIGSADIRQRVKGLVDGSLRLRKGERDNDLHRAMWGLANLPLKPAPSRALAEALLAPIIATMEGVEDEGQVAWTEKALSSFDRAMAERTVKDAQLEAARSIITPSGPEDWKAGLLTKEDNRGNLRLVANTANLDTLLEHDPEVGTFARFNVLKRKIEITGGPLKSTHEDVLDTAFANWCSRSQYKLEVNRSDAGAAILLAAQRRSYDPVADYLGALEWDGVPRIHTALRKYAEASGNNSFIENISRKFFIAAVARALAPGCQVDTVLVLQGRQGGGKTSFVRALGNGFHVETRLDLHSKDAVMVSTGNWLVELSEMASVKRGEVESVRAFITNKSDQIRLPYARAVTEYPRRCVFVGTTNAKNPLIDHEGNRRFWTVAVGKVDVPGLEQVRDQLWAEAVVAYRAGERWWLDDAEQIIADEEARVFETENPYVEPIQAWLDKQRTRPKHLTSWEVATIILHIEASRIAPITNSLIAAAMDKLQWKRERIRRGSSRVWAFLVPQVVTNEAELTDENVLDN